MHAGMHHFLLLILDPWDRLLQAPAALTFSCDGVCLGL